MLYIVYDIYVIWHVCYMIYMIYMLYVICVYMLHGIYVIWNYVIIREDMVIAKEATSANVIMVSDRLSGLILLIIITFNSSLTLTALH